MLAGKMIGRRTMRRIFTSTDLDSNILSRQNSSALLRGFVHKEGNFGAKNKLVLGFCRLRLKFSLLVSGWVVVSTNGSLANSRFQFRFFDLLPAKHFTTAINLSAECNIADAVVENEEKKFKIKVNEDQMKNSVRVESENGKHNFSLNSYRPETANDCPAFQRIVKKSPNPKPNSNHKDATVTRRIKANFKPNSAPKTRRIHKTNANPIPNPNPAAAAIIHRLVKADYNPNREEALNQCGIVVSEDLVLQVLSAVKSDLDSALFFFKWAAKQPGYTHDTEGYNEMLDILGKYKRFTTMWQLVFEMHKHKPSLVTDETFAILIRRYSSAHMVERATETFYRRTEFGLKLNTPAFQVLLDALCKHRHVQEAEALLYLKQKDFPPDMKSRNIILNGWCAFPNLREAKRFWNELIRQGYKLNLITYTTFISALAKKSKLKTALTLFDIMWEKGCIPDVVLCNTLLDSLCLKKGIPAALSVFGEMNERGCLPDVATYNTLIKHMCDARRVEEAYKLLGEMGRRGCFPNVRTYHYFIRVAERPEEALKVHQMMVKSGCMLTSDTYNLILKMFIGWNEMDMVRVLWDEMEKSGCGPDLRSYTVMVHGLHEKGKFDEAYQYYNEMTEKGLLPEPKTKLLVKAMEINLRKQKVQAYDSQKNIKTHRKAR